jgi:hypothetical protein
MDPKYISVSPKLDMRSSVNDSREQAQRSFLEIEATSGIELSKVVEHVIDNQPYPEFKGLLFPSGGGDDDDDGDDEHLQASSPFPIPYLEHDNVPFQASPPSPYSVRFQFHNILDVSKLYETGI